MILSNFTQGVWGKSWEKARETNAVQGTANLGDEGVVLDIPCGKLLGFPGVGINGKRESSTAEYLYGFSQDGYALALGNAAYVGGKTHYPGMAHQIIRADYLLAAKGCLEFDPSSMIKKMDIEVRNLADWYGKSAYCMIYETDGKNNTKFKSLEYRRDANAPRLLFDNDQCAITLFNKNTIPSLNTNEMTFRHLCGLRVCFSAGKSLEAACNFAADLSKFFSLCMGFHASIQKMKLYFDGRDEPVLYFAPLLDSPAPSKGAVRSMPFPYRAIEGEIGGYLCNWLGYGDEVGDGEDYRLLKHAGDLIVSILTYNWKMPVELQCVSISQALEAISRYKANLKSWPKSEFRKNQKDLIQRIDGMPEEFVHWVQRRLDQNSKSAKRLMNELMERQRDIAEWLIPDTEAFVSDQQKARNTHSHGSYAAALEPSRLYRLTMGSTLIGYTILWQLLGMSPAQIRRELERSHFKSWAVDWLRQQYPKKGLNDALISNETDAANGSGCNKSSNV